MADATYKIAALIRDRVESQAREQKTRTGKAMGQKAKDRIALDLWCGAATALIATEGEEAPNAKAAVMQAFLASVRGYSETLEMANRYDAAQAALKAAGTP